VFVCVTESDQVQQHLQRVARTGQTKKESKDNCNYTYPDGGGSMTTT